MDLVEVYVFSIIENFMNPKNCLFKRDFSYTYKVLMFQSFPVIISILLNSISKILNVTC